MLALHHAAICTADIDTSLRFWCDGMGLTRFFDHDFEGDWPTLFGATSSTLRSVFVGDPGAPQAGMIEFVGFDGADPTAASTDSPRNGFFLLSFERDVEPTLARLADLGFTDTVRRISVPVPGADPVAMAVITAPDGVVVELIGVGAADTSTLRNA